MSSEIGFKNETQPIGRTEEEIEEIKNEIWRNFSRISSAKPRWEQKPEKPPPPPKTLESELAKLRISSNLIKWEDYTKQDISLWGNWRSEVVGFASTKVEKKKVEIKTVQLQTDPILKTSIGIGDSGWISVHTQTDSYESEQNQPSTSKHTSYPPSLIAFVKKAGEMMIDEIRHNLNPTDFVRNEREERLIYLKADIGDRKFERFNYMRTLIPTRIHRIISPLKPKGLAAMSVSWSPGGTQIAVCHGEIEHEGFCLHRNVPLTIWSLTPSLLRKGPLHEILLDRCVTRVAFNPEFGNVLAFCTWMGEVGIVDLNGGVRVGAFGFDDSGGAGENTNNSSNAYEFNHRETFISINNSSHGVLVNSLVWIQLGRSELRQLVKKNTNPSPHLLVTASQDGYIALWSMNSSTYRLTLERRYAILAREIPDTYKKNNQVQFNMFNEIGITALDCFKANPVQFVCSTHGSFIFTGTLLSDKKFTELDLTNPQFSISEVYDPSAIFLNRSADLTSAIAANPVNTNIYAYTAKSSQLCIRNIKDISGEGIMEAYLSKNGTYDVKWSLRPMAFGLTNHKSAFVYDLLIEEGLEIFNLEHEAICLGMAWSKTEMNYVAVADSEGYINIWRLPIEIAEYDFTEHEQLDNYANSSENRDLGLATSERHSSSSPPQSARAHPTQYNNNVEM